MNSAENDLNSLVYYFFREYLPGHKGLSKKTIQSYRETFKLFLKWIFAERGSKKISVADIKPVDILKFLKFLEDERSNSARTRNIRLAGLKSFFSMCYIKSACDRRHLEAVQFIPVKRTTNTLIDFFEHDDVIRIFTAIDRTTQTGKRDYLVLNLLYDTGMRASELAGLSLKGFDRKNETLEILGKGSKWRKIRIWPRTSQLLVDYIENWRQEPKPAYKDHAIVSHRREALTRFGIHKISGKYLKKVSIKKQIANTKRSAAHSWRHSAAVNMLRLGLSLHEIKVRLGHESLDTTGKYMNLDLSQKRERLEEYVRFTKELLTAEILPEAASLKSAKNVFDLLNSI